MSDRPSVDEALSVIRGTISALGAEWLPARRTLGRRLAQPAHAVIDVPRFASSAMDGFAVASGDTTKASAACAVDLPIGAPVQAGAEHSTLSPMTAASISTGAPVPAGADAVVTRERASVIESALRLCEPIPPLSNIRSVGEDLRSGQCVLPAGAVLTADAIGALIGCGVDRVSVHRRPRLLLFSNGNELTESYRDLGPGATIVDSNTPMIEAFAVGLGLDVETLGTAQDRDSSIDAMLDRAMASASTDLVISTGGVSGGAFDLVRARIEAMGGTIHLHGIRMRPGRPLLFATLPDGRPYFGLPGNPVAALVGMRFFVMAAIRSMAGLPPETGQEVIGDRPGRSGTTEFLRGRAIKEGGVVVCVDTDLDQRSHVLSSVVAADTWLRVDQEISGEVKQTVFGKVPPPV